MNDLRGRLLPLYTCIHGRKHKPESVFNAHLLV